VFSVAPFLKDLQSHNLFLEGTLPENFTGLTSDSRSLEESGTKWIFFARRGVAKDGHEFLNGIARHPHVVGFVVEKKPDGFAPQVPVLVVRDATATMAIACKMLNGDPTSSAFCAAVTGTNGKTTSTFLIQSLLKTFERRPARLGTIEVQFEDFSIPSNLTTPDFSFLQSTFETLRKKGANAFVFEASSHALDQRRLLGIELDAAIFTNLTQDHLDYHRTMESYYLAKKKLFSELLGASAKPIRHAIVPLDGTYGSRLFTEIESDSRLKVSTWGYSGKQGTSESRNHLQVDSWKSELSGSSMVVTGMGLKSQEFRTSLVGRHNVDNVMGIVTLGVSMGMSAKAIQQSLDTCPPVSGRLERVTASKGFIFVDYAHTPDALENILQTLRPLTGGKLRVVFGCGGDRDKTKRSKMGSIAELYADEVVVTSDNPRTEDPELIIQEILSGIQRIKPVHVEVQRREGIRRGLQNLGAKDVLVIAGKGHEDYQIIGTQKFPFDDRKIALEILKEMGN